MRRVLLSLALSAGCATTPSRTTPEPAAPAAAPAPEVAAAPPAQAPAPVAAVEEGPVGVIPRAALDRVLAASPGLFLQHVSTAPSYRAGRFAGWKVASFFPGDPRFERVDLHAGDVVTRVNGSTVERPEQLLELWRRLKTGSELVVELERDGRPRTLRWTITP